MTDIAVTPPATAALSRATNEIDAVVRSILPLANAFRDVASSPRGVSRDQLSTLRGPIDAILAAHRGLVGGAGVVTAPGLLADAPYWLEWWWARPNKAPERLRVNLEPSAPDFFDYTTAEWFVTPETTGRAHAAGPYVDYVCSNEYAITVSIPVFVNDRFVGVAGADVPIAGLERLVLPELVALSPHATLTNSAGRVIASASASVAPGLRLDLDGVTSTRLAPSDSSDAPAWDWRLIAAI